VIVGDRVKLAVRRRLEQSPSSRSRVIAAPRRAPGRHTHRKNFVLKDAGTADGLEWLEATPKNKDTSFERIRMGFKGDTLVQMELFDFFGQRTTLKLSHMVRNPSIRRPASPSPRQGATSSASNYSCRSRPRAECGR